MAAHAACRQTHLQDLRLCSDWPRLGAQDAEHLTSCCRNLTNLDMPPLDGDPAQVLAPLCKLKQLQQLAITGCNLNDAAMESVAQLTWLTHLVVNLGFIHMTTDISVTGAGLLHLVALKQLRYLRVTPFPVDYRSSTWLQLQDTVSHSLVWLTHLLRKARLE